MKNIVLAGDSCAYHYPLKIVASKRNKAFDNVRALCALFIVGFWHLRDYYGLTDLSDFFYVITDGVLAEFTFLSALFNGTNCFYTFKDVMHFYKKRLRRIYPMFFLVSTVFLILYFLLDYGVIKGISQYILTILGLACISTQPPLTIWYVSMLLLFYLITPVVMIHKKKKYQIVVSFLLFVVLLSVSYFFSVDSRVILFFPFYLMGLILCNMKEKFHLVFNLKNNILLFLLLLLLLYFRNNSFFVLYPLCICVIYFVLEVGFLLEKSPIISYFLSYISYGSFAAYLFHRLCFGAFCVFCKPFPIWFAYFVVLPFTLFFSYFIQKLFDKIN